MLTRTFTREDVSDEANSILALLRTRRRAGASVLALCGNLGAGKTTVVQAVAKLLGVSEDVTSPTFVILKSYRATDADFTKLLHIDAYRIEDLDELKILGFEQEIKNPQTLIIIEWAERVAQLLPEDTLHVTLAHVDSDTRTIAYA